jgi:hypothetical protein
MIESVAGAIPPFLGKRAPGRLGTIPTPGRIRPQQLAERINTQVPVSNLDGISPTR